MRFLNVDVTFENTPVLDKGFIPLGSFMKAFLKTAKKPVSVAVFRNNGLVSVYDTFVHGTEEMREADRYYLDRLVKLLLWIKGGSEVGIYGDENLSTFIIEVYSQDGARAFDCNFMAGVYEKQFVVRGGELCDKVAEKEEPIQAGGNFNGCRIGFDAGGSDRKVSAVIDGEVVYSEEVLWFPKTNSDPRYHYDGILEAFKTAASKMPRVDAIGISSAGIYVNNRTMVASLFLKVSAEDFKQHVKDIYINAAAEIGDVPVAVANDGDVTALAGAMDLKDTNVLGIAMGTSQAVGYVDKDGNITGWLNELAFAPVDCQPGAMADEWSGDIGCGVKYFSQDAVIKLAPAAGIELDENASPAEKLKLVQKLMENNDSRAAEIFQSIGVYLGHSIALYDMFYDIKHILLLGRVMSGNGGSLIVETAKHVIEQEYPSLCDKITLHLPDENSRRVGQSVAAASLPKLNITF